MTPDEMTAVATALREAALICGRRVTDELIQAYLHALEEVDPPALVRALTRFARSATSETRFPTPAELRQRAGGTVIAPDAPLSDTAFARVRDAVFTALNAWEYENPSGSARPVFDATWKAARRREGWGGTTTQRETLWREWLEAGVPLTQAEMDRRLADVAPHVTPALRAILETIGRRATGQTRDPGEEG